MALTAEGRALTEAHRLAQIDVADATMTDLGTAFDRLLDLRQISATFPAYFEAAFAVLDRDHLRSTALSAAYLEAFHNAEGLQTKPLDLREAQGLATEQALSTLFATGPGHYLGSQARGDTYVRSADLARAGTLKGAMRLSLQGGRYTITDTVQATDAIVGVARVTDGHPCAFCAMLASRGAVYKSEASASFKPHNGCACQPEPVYGGGNYMAPGRAKEFRDLYNEIPGGLSPADTRRAFRGLYERGAIPEKYLSK